MTVAVVRTSSRTRKTVLGILSIGTWPAAALLILLHARGVAVASPRAFAILWTWIVALGCCGAPVYGLRLLGARLTTFAARSVGLVFAGVAFAVTGLLAAGQLHPRTSIVYASLILPMAVAIQAFNGAEVLEREQRAYEAGRRDALAEQLRERSAVAATLRRFDDATLAELEAEHDAFGLIIEAKRQDQTHAKGAELHLLPDPDEHDDDPPAPDTNDHAAMRAVRAEEKPRSGPNPIALLAPLAGVAGWLRDAHVQPVAASFALVAALGVLSGAPHTAPSAPPAPYSGPAARIPAATATRIPAPRATGAPSVARRTPQAPSARAQSSASAPAAPAHASPQPAPPRPADAPPADAAVTLTAGSACPPVALLCVPQAPYAVVGTLTLTVSLPISSASPSTRSSSTSRSRWP